MAIDFEIVKTALFNWVSAQVPIGMPVIFYEPNAPRPNRSYITLYLNTIDQISWDWYSHKANAAGEIDMHGDRRFTLQIQAYGSDPLTVLENLRSSLQKQTVLDTLRANGLAFYNFLSINDITDLIDSRYERRAQMDLRFGIGQSYIDSPGYFDHTQINEKVFNAAEILVYDEVIQIPEV